MLKYFLWLYWKSWSAETIFIPEVYSNCNAHINKVYRWYLHSCSSNLSILLITVFIWLNVIVCRKLLSCIDFRQVNDLMGSILLCFSSCIHLSLVCACHFNVFGGGHVFMGSKSCDLFVQSWGKWNDQGIIILVSSSYFLIMWQADEDVQNFSV